MQTRAHYFDGQTSTRHAVTLALQGDRLELRGDGISRDCPLTTLKLTPPVGGVSRTLRLADGGICEIDDTAFVAALEKLLGRGFQSLVHRLENRLRYALSALVVAAALLFAFIQFGIPGLARATAFALPAKTENLIGGESLQILERLYFEPSALSEERQTELQRVFDDVSEEVAPSSGYRLLCRASKPLGANAFALPGGTVVVTDDLVGLVEDEREFAAVMAHEIGHLQQRHALRQVLQSMGTGLVVVALTGDVTSITSTAAAIPTALVQAGFSREMEREADDAAAAWLHARGYTIDLYGQFLKRLEEDHYRRHPRQDSNNEDGIGDYFSTHPSTRERLERLEASQTRTL